MLSDASIKLFKAAGAYYVPTLSTVNGYIERLAANPNAYPPDVLAKVQWRIGVTGKSLEKAYPAGVKIAFGTDAGVSKHGKNADEFELMVKHGMPASAAIQAATMNAATLLGVDKEVGSLEPGKAADVVLWNANPFSVYARPEKVWIDGAVMYDWADPKRRPTADFELGQQGAGDTK
jgi:imidazolonepropionase-like amidohydrolase